MEKKLILIIVGIVVAITIAISISLLTCPGQCYLRGYNNAACKSSPVVPDPKACNQNEIDIGSTMDCNPGGLLGVMYHCCCK